MESDHFGPALRTNRPAPGSTHGAFAGTLVCLALLAGWLGIPHARAADPPAGPPRQYAPDRDFDLHQLVGRALPGLDLGLGGDGSDVEIHLAEP